ncbi:leucine-rich repeat-containing protein kinase family protein [Uliginosibacterium sediminicola]|uniref:Leucine-rich repeat-containing protein kinase family protein n=1 Tax=Uliginosibacterium sediminicola TaxID=2024550 RepID=A0ABU9YVK4_9RHOO
MKHTLEQLRAGELAGVRRLSLSCGLREFPAEIFSLADSLEILDLSGNALSTLPDALVTLPKLRIVFCSDNQFTALPEVLGRCPALTMIGFKANRIRHVSPRALPAGLRWLVLTDNAIEALPEEIGQCTQLQKLMLAGNRLRSLPASLAQCTRLELLRIAANQLAALPDCLLGLPRLSWLAFAGNPFCAALESAALGEHSIPDIDWAQLDVDVLLGEGASGQIYRAHCAQPGEGRLAVALKLFKGAVTSDGLPQCEMAAAIRAGQHPGLIGVLGRVQGHPQQAQALVMPLIDAAFRNLAGPPSLDSCTRDIYAEDTRFDLPAALAMAQRIASAAAHLHARGIMHGDLYAHNTLHCGQGRALLGDFGAASFYAPDAPVASALQRMEVRAFGCLLEELLERSRVAPQEAARLAALQALAADCLSESPAQRPLFAEIEARLQHG